MRLLLGYRLSFGSMPFWEKLNPDSPPPDTRLLSSNQSTGDGSLTSFSTFSTLSTFFLLEFWATLLRSSSFFYCMAKKSSSGASEAGALAFEKFPPKESPSSLKGFFGGSEGLSWGSIEGSSANGSTEGFLACGVGGLAPTEGLSSGMGSGSGDPFLTSLLFRSDCTLLRSGVACPGMDALCLSVLAGGGPPNEPNLSLCTLSPLFELNSFTLLKISIAWLPCTDEKRFCLMTGSSFFSMVEPSILDFDG